MRILVVDEDRHVARALERVLQRAGAEVVVLCNLLEMAALVDSQPFDVLIGEELAVMVLKELAPSTRRGLLTGDLHEWTAEQLEALGVEFVVEKPWDSERLLRDLKLVV